MQDESHLTERSLREALEKMGMGSRKNDAARNESQPSQYQSKDDRGRITSRNRPTQAPARRRRFAGDDTVVVEHQSLGRPSQKRNMNRMAAGTEAGQEQERLKQSLQRERRRAHDAETEIGVLGERIRAANTQVTHLRLQVEEGQNALRKRDEDILRLRAELHQLREQKSKRPATAVKPSTDTSRTGAPQESGEEPVQWWTD